jgi:photosystem II stability/assembly factor-like uncharacterized protein
MTRALTSRALALAAALACAAALAAEKPSPKEAAKGAGKHAGQDEKKEPFSADTFTGLALRELGPALTSGRIVDIAVSSRPGTYFVAAASGGLWKTNTWGASWTSVFDKQASYSIGCIAIDPKDPLTVWVGSGENNSQRSVAYGDGVYKSVDGGKSWENVGLKASEHIGKIVIDPRDGRVVYVAAQGPLWNPGGDRGLFKTTDGGKSWKAVLSISENTGVSDVWLDPRNPDVVYAASYQRRRHVWTLIDGGPESAIYKSTDAGASFQKLTSGLPKGDLGRIGLAVSPADPDVVYALIEASDKKAAGTYRSLDAGANWERRGDYVPGGPQYYQELVPDPKVVERVYSMDVFMKVTEDGGKTWRNAGEKDKHVDNHALWIDPDNVDHLLNGNDGGVYESWDRGQTWEFKANLPITQFYRVAVDQAEPFYNVYGGTQDNFSLGGPSRTRNAHGIRNGDWFVTLGGDGFEPQVDPKDPNIIYTQLQYGNLARFDRRTGEKLDIQPQPGPGDDPLRWNWDSPLLISPHAATRLYFAAQRVFRSDDRGDTWRAISPDLTAQIDRNKLKVMGRVWSVDAVAKNSSTSFYGNIVSLDESPKQEGLIYVGTDDGLLQVTEDGGGSWRKHERFPGVPERSYVSDVLASRHDAKVVYASFDNHKMGDYKPYLLRSTDRGRTWSSIAANLPERGAVYTVAEDHVKRELLFAGTEFGLFFTADGGAKWVQPKGGLPPIPVRDLEIQRREDDLVLATFGRGFYVLDDYAPLRQVTPQLLEAEATLFAPRRALMYVPEEPLGLKGKSFQGVSLYAAPNPPFGAVFTYYLKDELKTKRKQRQEQEQKTAEKGGDAFYPPWEALEAEQREEDPAIVLTVTDDAGNVVRRVTGPTGAGFHRVAWDLRYPPADPTSLEPPQTDNPFVDPPIGPLAMPGRYSVSLAKRVEGKLTPLGAPQGFATEVLGTASLPAPDRAQLLAFQQKTARLQRAALGAVQSAGEANKRIDHLKKALEDTPKADARLMDEVRALEARLREIQVALSGGSAEERYNEPTLPAIVDRIQRVVSGHWTTTSAPTNTQRRQYDVAAEQFEGVLRDLTRLVETDLRGLEERAEAAGAPWTPGRVPRWARE